MKLIKLILLFLFVIIYQNMYCNNYHTFKFDLNSKIFSPRFGWGNMGFKVYLKYFTNNGNIINDSFVSNKVYIFKTELNDSILINYIDLNVIYSNNVLNDTLIYTRVFLNENNIYDECNLLFNDKLFNNNNCAYGMIGNLIPMQMCGTLTYKPTRKAEIKDNSVMRDMGGHFSRRLEIYCEPEVTDQEPLLRLIAPCFFKLLQKNQPINWFESESSNGPWQYLCTKDTMYPVLESYKKGDDMFNKIRYYKCAIDSTFFKHTRDTLYSNIFFPIRFFLPAPRMDSIVAFSPKCNQKKDMIFYYKNNSYFVQQGAPRIWGYFIPKDSIEKERMYFGKVSTSPASVVGKVLQTKNDPYKDYYFGKWYKDSIFRLKEGTYIFYYDFTPSNGFNCKFYYDTFKVTIANDFKGVTAIKKEPTCFGNNNGEIKWKVVGDDSLQTFTVSSDGLIFKPLNTVFSNLKAGTYHFYLKNERGCTEHIVETLNEPEPLKLAFSEIKNNICANSLNGSISKIKIEGGIKPYSISIDSNLFTQDTFLNQLKTAQYQFFIKDKNQCLKDTFFNILTPNKLQIVSAIFKPILCNNAKNASIRFLIKAGVRPYQYQLNNQAFVSDSFYTGLDTGTYYFKIKDANNCIETYKQTINQMSPLGIDSVILNHNICNGTELGKIQIFVKGGIKPYIYQLDNNMPKSANSFDNLKANNYNILIKDSNLCSINKSVSILEGKKINIPKINDTTLCNNQFAIYNFLNANTNLFKISSSIGDSLNTKIFTLNKAGIYYLLAKDSNQCEHKDTWQINKQNLSVTHDFLIPSKAFLNDTIVAVNTCNPLSTLNYWQLNSNFKDSVQNNNFELHFNVNDTGKYTLTLKSIYQSCVYLSIKDFEIISHNDSDKIDIKFGYKGPMIKKFLVSPNPNDGNNYKLLIELRDTANILVQKIDVSSGAVVENLNLNQTKFYNQTPFVLTKAQVFYIRIIVGNESKTIKIVAIP